MDHELKRHNYTKLQEDWNLKIVLRSTFFPMVLQQQVSINIIKLMVANFCLV